MKRIIQLTIVIIVLMFFISGCNLKPNYYKEDVLYSEKDLSNYKSIETDMDLKNNLMTRQEAIDKAREVFKNGLNIDLSQMPVSDVRLFKQSNEEYFVWNICWNKEEDDILYKCDIDSSTGEIISIYVNRYEKKKILEENLEEKYLHTSDEDVYSIISPLMTSLEINIKEYELINMGDGDMYEEVNKLYEFRNINNKEESFVIRIDWSRGKVLSYEKITYNKEKIHY
ncbi:hypothetical protein [Clostridium sp.]|uniref:hypothetical protein n=1 Tax=Clostridium sp. TaxID=1506 RepID=UPI003464DA9A